MHNQAESIPEFENVITLLEKMFPHASWALWLKQWENVIFSGLVIVILSLFFWIVGRRLKLVPGRMQSFAEVLIETLDGLVCGIMGKEKGRKYLPFVGTLFVYIITLNLIGLIPLLKSSTSSLSTTAAMGLTVFVYVTYTAIKELGFFGFFDHLAGKPRGVMALTVVMPTMMFVLHFLSEIIRPVTLSLRLRSNVWGDDVLLALFAGMGLKALPLLFFNTLLVIMASTVQAVVFCLLATIYFSLVVNTHEH